MNVLFLVSKCECKTQLVILLYKYDNGDFKDRKTISKSLSFIYKENRLTPACIKETQSRKSYEIRKKETLQIKMT